MTTRNFPAAIAGLAANVVLLLLLVPPLGLAGAGLALCGAYVVMLSVMHLLTRRAFAVQFEWRRLAQLVVVMGGLAAAGDLAAAHPRRVGFLAARAVCGGDPAGAAGHRLCPPAPSCARPGRCCPRLRRRASPAPAAGSES